MQMAFCILRKSCSRCGSHRIGTDDVSENVHIVPTFIAGKPHKGRVCSVYCRVAISFPYFLIVGGFVVVDCLPLNFASSFMDSFLFSQPMISSTDRISISNRVFSACSAARWRCSAAKRLKEGELSGPAPPREHDKRECPTIDRPALHRSSGNHFPQPAWA